MSSTKKNAKYNYDIHADVYYYVDMINIYQQCQQHGVDYLYRICDF